MARKKRISDEALIAAVRSSTSVNGVLARLHLAQYCGNWRTVNARIKQLGLATDHFNGKAHMRGKHNPHVPKLPLETILVVGSAYTNMTRLKLRLLQAGLLVNSCAVCACLPTWRNLPLVLVLDHVNGDHTDNRLSNLRLLCPNCNSQQATFAGRNRRQ